MTLIRLHGRVTTRLVLELTPKTVTLFARTCAHVLCLLLVVPWCRLGFGE